MTKLNRDLLTLVKQGFVPQPGGAAEPAAGAGPMTAGMAAPMDPGMGGMPPDPGMDPGMGGMPMDPGMGGGMPPPGLDPAMAGMMGGGMPPPPPGGEMSGSSTLTLTVDDLIKLFKVFQKNSGPGVAEPVAPAPQSGGQDPRLDQIINMLQGALGVAEQSEIDRM